MFGLFSVEAKKEGGKVILEDTVLLEDVYRKEVLGSFGKRLGLTEILTVKDIGKLFKTEGYKLIQSQDLSRDLLSTYSHVLKKLRFKRNAIGKILDSRGKESRLDFQSSYDLVRQKKLGAMFILFEK